MAKQKEADLFHAGTLTDGWKWFGAHPEERRGRKGWVFRVWAPHAKAVSVVGDFNNWNQKANKLSRKGEIWEGFIADLPAYTTYKYCITGADGEIRMKAANSLMVGRPSAWIVSMQKVSTVVRLASRVWKRRKIS